MEILNNLDTIVQNFLLSLGIWGPIFSCILILIESILPVLPLAVFITLNFMYFGNIFGFFISLLFTILGCYISFIIFRKGFSIKFQKKIKEKDKLENLMIKFSSISVGALAALVAMPFTPAFLVNIAAGLSNMSRKKFIFSMIIGKTAMVYFWGYVGTSLINSITNPILLIRIGFIMLVAYILSKGLNKILKID